MNSNPNDRSEVEGIFSGADLTTLVDLQKFLADEVAQGAEKGVDLTRAFTPLTDGLGIHVSGTARPAAGANKGGPVAYVPPGVSAVTEFRSTTPMEKTKPATRLIVDPGVDTETARALDSFEYQEPPPPVPAATTGRRLLAGLVDQCFVLTAWLLAMAITSNAMSSGTGDLSSRFLREFGNPAFVRAAGLEFGMIWLGYLILSIGILEMTFGMWVWGLRVSFGETGRFWKKVARIVMGMFFYPFVVPTALLLLRKDGRTLIDAVTQTDVYRTTPQ